MKKILILVALASCTSAERSKFGGYGKNYTIKVVSCDTIITYNSDGKVQSENNSDGYYFTDAATGKLVEVSGNVIIEEK